MTPRPGATPSVTVGVLLAIAALFTSLPTHAAQDCPELGLTGAQEDEYCGAFRELLYAPARPNDNRGVSKRKAKQAQGVIESDPLWREVFRADPERTLDLIARIKRVGGLPVE